MAHYSKLMFYDAVPFARSSPATLVASQPVTSIRAPAEKRVRLLSSSFKSLLSISMSGVSSYSTKLASEVLGSFFSGATDSNSSIGKLKDRTRHYDNAAVALIEFSENPHRSSVRGWT